MKVKVKTGWLTGDPEVVVWLIDAGNGKFDVYPEHRGLSIGQVYKSTYRWSPPAAGFGGRIVRFHKECPCWRNSAADDWQHWRTRWEAIADLLRRSSSGGER